MSDLVEEGLKEDHGLLLRIRCLRKESSKSLPTFALIHHLPQVTVHVGIV